MSDIRTLRPGLLVSVKTTMEGNKTYDRQVIEAEHIDDNGESRERWEVLKVIEDPDEHKEALKARSRARTQITRICSQSDFGLLCPASREDELKAGIAEARRIAKEFNTEAKLTKLSINVICGHVVQDDVEAVAAISGELRELIDTMKDGLNTGDAKAARDAASRAKNLGQMLSADTKRQVDDLVAEARKEARKIVKAGEAAAIEIDAEVIAKLDAARTSFLDLEDVAATYVAHPDADARVIDLPVEA